MGTLLAWVILGGMVVGDGSSGNPGGCKDPSEEACAYGGEAFLKQFVPMCVRRNPNIKAPALEDKSATVALMRRVVFCDCLPRKAAKYITPENFVKSVVQDHEDRKITLEIYTNVKTVCVDYTLQVTEPQGK